VTPVLFSPHAEAQLDDIVVGIAIALGVDDGLRWEAKLREAALSIADFPEIGPNVPADCFCMPPPDLERLHQVLCRPYRIVYEVTDTECHVLSIRHTRMMLGSDDTSWS